MKYMGNQHEVPAQMSDPMKPKTGADPHAVCLPVDRPASVPRRWQPVSDRDADRIFRQATAFVERAMERTNGENTEQ